MITATSIALYLLGWFFLIVGVYAVFYGAYDYKGDGRYGAGLHPMDVITLLGVSAGVLTMASILWKIA